MPFIQGPETERLRDEDLLKLAYTDDLTGLYNRRYFMQRLRLEIEEATRQDYSVSLLLIDVDHFKAINDGFGHRAGDLALSRIAEMLREASSGAGEAYRFAGDEFTILLPKVVKEEALSVAEELNRLVSHSSVEVGKGGKHIQPTLSIGLASYPADAAEPSDLIERADRALYRSKDDGRNRTTAASAKDEALSARIDIKGLFVRAPHLGRDPEVKRIRDILSPSRPSGAHWTIVSGGKGLGKTRFLREAMSIAEQIGLRSVFLTGTQFSSLHPYGSIQGLVDKYVKYYPEQAAERLREIKEPFGEAFFRLFPDLESSFVKWIASKQISERESRLFLFHNIVRFLSALLGDTPTLLCMDDFQYVDDASCFALASILKNPKAANLSLLCSVPEPSAPGEETAFYRKVAEEISESVSVEEIHLKPFSKDLLQSLVRALFPGAEMPDGFLELLWNRTEGRPLELEEALKLLIDKRKIHLEEGGWIIETTDKGEIPSSLEGIMVERVGTLDEESREVLQAAAAVGENVSMDLLRELEEKNEGYLLEILDRVERKAIIADLEPGTFQSYDFHNPALQEAVYGTLPKEERVALHDRIAHIEERLFQGDLLSALPRLVHHFKRANNLERSRELALQVEELFKENFLPSERTVYLKERPKWKEWGKEAVLRDEKSRTSVRALQLMKVAIQNFRLFSPHSSVVEDSCRKLHEALCEILSETESLSFNEASGSVLINGEEPELTSSSKKFLRDLFFDLGEIGIKGVTFHQGVSIEDIRRFLRLLSERYEGEMEKEGWDALLEQEGVQRILINEKFFVAVAERALLDKEEKIRIRLMDEAEKEAPMPDLSGLVELVEGIREKAAEGGERVPVEQLNEVVELLRQLASTKVHLASGVPEAARAKSSRPVPAGVPPVSTGDLEGDVEILLDDLGSLDPGVLKAASSRLVAMGKDAVPQLVELICGSDSLRKRRVAARILARIESEAAKVLLEQLRSTYSYDAQKRILSVMKEFDDPVVEESLIDFLVCPSIEARKEAFRALRSIHPETVEGILLERIGWKEEGVAADIVAFLGELRSRQAVEPFLKRLKKMRFSSTEEGEKLQRETCLSLGKIGDPSAVPVLYSLLKRRSLFSFRKTAKTSVRAAAAWALGEIGTAEAAVALQRAAEDPDAAISSVAKLAIERALEEEAGEEANALGKADG